MNLFSKAFLLSLCLPTILASTFQARPQTSAKNTTIHAENPKNQQSTLPGLTWQYQTRVQTCGPCLASPFKLQSASFAMRFIQPGNVTAMA